MSVCICFRNLVLEEVLLSCARRGQFARALDICEVTQCKPAESSLKLWAMASPRELSIALRGPLAGHAREVSEGLTGLQAETDLIRAEALSTAGAFKLPEEAERWGALLRSGVARWSFVDALIERGVIRGSWVARGQARKAAILAIGAARREGALRGSIARVQARFLLKALRWDADATRVEFFEAWRSSGSSMDACEEFWARRAEPAALRFVARSLASEASPCRYDSQSSLRRRSFQRGRTSARIKKV